MALAGKAAEELQAGSGIESRTIHSMEYRWKNGRDMLTANDVVVVDEAGMVGTRQLERVRTEVDRAGAKLVLVGDDKQLAQIEAGAGFRTVRERVGEVELTEIRRQKEEWARDASKSFARGDFRAAMDAYEGHGAVQLADNRDAAKAQLAADWLADRDQGGSSLILTHTNADVRDLNDMIRDTRRQAGELGEESGFQTERGERQFAQGDRLVFLQNSNDLNVKNGMLGTVSEAKERYLAVDLDNGGSVQFAQADYGNVDHGYAVTIHKAQGVTVDRAYVLASPTMDRNLTYVGMTRHRDAATMYAGRDDFRDYDHLTQRLSRGQVKESTLDYVERQDRRFEQEVSAPEGAYERIVRQRAEQRAAHDATQGLAPAQDHKETATMDKSASAFERVAQERAQQRADRDQAVGRVSNERQNQPIPKGGAAEQDQSPSAFERMAQQSKETQERGRSLDRGMEQQ